MHNTFSKKRPLNQHWLKLLDIFYYKFIYVYVKVYNSIMDRFSLYYFWHWRYN